MLSTLPEAGVLAFLPHPRGSWPYQLEHLMAEKDESDGKERKARWILCHFRGKSSKLL